MLVLTKVLIGITIAVCVCAGVAVALYFGLNNQKSSTTSSNNDEDSNTEDNVDYITVTGLSMGQNSNNGGWSPDSDSIQSYSDCQDFCENDPSCNVFSYFPGFKILNVCTLYDFNTDDGENTYYINEIYYNNTNTERKVGFKCSEFESSFCKQDMVEFMGYENVDISLNLELSNDYPNCIEECVNSDDCNAIKFNSSSNTCVGYSQQFQSTSATRDISSNKGYAFIIDSIDSSE